MALGGRSSRVTLFTEFYERKFIAHSFSWGNLFHIFIILVMIILPFILSFQAGSKILKRKLINCSILGQARRVSGVAKGHL